MGKAATTYEYFFSLPLACNGLPSIRRSQDTEAAAAESRISETREEMAREKFAMAEAEALQEVREIAIDVALAAAKS